MPMADQVEERVKSLKLKPGMSWRQGSPYGWDTYLTPNGGRLTLYLWGNNLTSVKLVDGRGVTTAEVKFRDPGGE